MNAKSILILDASTVMRRMIAFTLEASGYRVTQTSSATEALTAIETNPFELIIADPNLTGMDEIELIRRVRNAANHDQTPILLLSTAAASRKLAAARKAGATGWITKPFQPATFVEVVSRVI